MPMSARTQPVYDEALHQAHLAQVARLFPGPDYYTVLRWIHEILRPANYVEIGVRRGASFRLKLPESIGVGIDPEPGFDQATVPMTRIFRTTSDRFFEEQKLPEILAAPTVALAFIDGLHLFDQALMDFINLEQFAGPRSIIMIHDCLPLDELTSARVRTTRFYSGDVWKMVVCLKRERPDLRMATVRTGPTGLCLVARPDPRSQTLREQYQELVAQYAGLNFAQRQAPGLQPETIENSFNAVRSWLDAAPA